MATTYVGNDGDVSGFIGAKLNVWNATFSRIAHDITGFSNAGRERKLGLVDIVGNAGGLLQSDTTDPWSLTTNRTGASVSLYILQATNTADSVLTFNAVVSDVAMNVAKAGDAGVTFSFSLSSTALAYGSLFTSTWQTS